MNEQEIILDDFAKSIINFRDNANKVHNLIADMYEKTDGFYSREEVNIILQAIFMTLQSFAFLVEYNEKGQVIKSLFYFLRDIEHRYANKMDSLRMGVNKNDLSPSDSDENKSKIANLSSLINEFEEKLSIFINDKEK